MATEQGGFIIYGIEEWGETGFRIAIAVGEGFVSGDKVEREWFLQVTRDHIKGRQIQARLAQAGFRERLGL
jgi:hypothetical protein